MSLPKRKFPTLKEKLEEKAVLEKELEKVEDEITKVEGDKKVKIKRNKK